MRWHSTEETAQKKAGTKNLALTCDVTVWACFCAAFFSSSSSSNCSWSRFISSPASLNFVFNPSFCLVSSCSWSCTSFNCRSKLAFALSIVEHRDSTSSSWLFKLSISRVAFETCPSKRWIDSSFEARARFASFNCCSRLFALRSTSDLPPVTRWSSCANSAFSSSRMPLFFSREDRACSERDVYR